MRFRIEMLISVAMIVLLGGVLALSSEAYSKPLPLGSAGVNLAISQQVEIWERIFPCPPARLNKRPRSRRVAGPSRRHKDIHADDTDSAWAQEIDIDGDGNVEERPTSCGTTKIKVLYICTPGRLHLQRRRHQS